MKALNINAQPKEVLTDEALITEWSDVIHPKKDGGELQKIILELKATMKKNGFEYLTAPQIGYNKRVFCIKFGNDYRTFVNPMIENNTGISFQKETCNSLPGRKFIRPRFSNLLAHYQTPLGKIESTKLVGRAAVVFAHCVDHLDGMLVSDIGLEIDDDFDKLTEDEAAEIIRLYAESLDIKQKQLTEEIESDADTKQILDAAKFIQGVQSGEVQLDIPGETSPESYKKE